MTVEALGLPITSLAVAEGGGECDLWRDLRTPCVLPQAADWGAAARVTSFQRRRFTPASSCWLTQRTR